MKLIFKIYKKVRELKKEERKIKENIEEAKLEERQITEQNNIFQKIIFDIPYDLKMRQQAIEREQDQLKESWNNLRCEERRLDKLEKELNSLQVKINDQILKLGIFKGVNNEVN